MPEQLQAQAAVRRRRRLRRVLLAVASLPALYVLVGVVLSILVFAENDRIRREGDPVSLEQTIPDMPPDAENGALIYEKTFALIGQPDKFPVLYSIANQTERERNPGLWTKAEAEMLRCAPIVDLARKAAAMPHCVFGADWKRGYYPANSKVRRLARLLCGYAAVLAHSGKTNEAFRILALATRVVDGLEGSSFIPQMIRADIRYRAGNIAYESVAKARVAEVDARTLCDALAYDDLGTDTPLMLKSERATYNSAYDEIIQSGSLHWYGYTLDDLTPLGRFECSLAGRPVLLADRLQFLRATRLAIENARTPFRRLKNPDPDGKRCACQPRGPLFADKLTPELYTLRTCIESSKARIDGTRLAIAACFYRNKFGTYPLALSQLSRLGWRLDMEDPFSGRNFVYRREGDGFILYSIGSDLIDNGGKRDTADRWPQDGYDMVWQTQH